MADKDYSIKYDTSSAVPAGKNVGLLAQAIAALDTIVNRFVAAGKNLIDVLNRIAAAAAKAQKAVDAFNASMAAATGQATSYAAGTASAAAATTDMGSAATVANGAMKTAGTTLATTAYNVQRFTHAAGLAAPSAKALGSSFQGSIEHVREFDKVTRTAVIGTGDLTSGMNAIVPAGGAMGATMQETVIHMKDTTTATTEATEGFEGLRGGLSQFITIGLGITALTKIVQEYAAAVKEGREFDVATADSNFDKREQARELAFNMGQNGPNDRVMGSIFETAIASGMTFDEALKHNQELEGSVVAGKLAGNVRDDQMAEVKKKTAVVARRSGLDAKTAGDMAGVILHDMNVNTDANGKQIDAEKAGDMVAAKLDSMITALAAGRGNVSTLARGRSVRGWLPSRRGIRPGMRCPGSCPPRRITPRVRRGPASS
jgi:hypothetical protein